MKIQKVALSFLVSLVFICSCKKSDQLTELNYLKQRVHSNGGVYKNESISIQTQNGVIKTGHLDWRAVAYYSINGAIYTDIPFFFFDGGLQLRDLNSATSFSLVLRENSSGFEVALKITQNGSFLRSDKSVLFGKIENYFTVDGNWINSWFIESVTGKLYRRSSSNLEKRSQVSANSNTIKATTNSTISCYSFSTPSYEIHCSPTDPENPSYDVTCVWVNVGVGVVVFCFDSTGGGGNEVVEQWPPSSGTTGTQQQNQGVPCPGDVIKNPRIARSNPANTNGGRFGPTRRNQDGTPKMHKGLDIYALPGTPIYAAFSGVVRRSISSFPPNYYGGPTSFGNLIEIESTLSNGEIVRTLYAHLNSTPLSIGDSVQQGQEIGMSGRTGNAQKGYSPHVHVQITQNGEKKNPENFLTTKFSASGTPINNPCN